ncbi:phosphomannomutase/phosphoglucomutase [Spirochaeta isovalerica]|uniref:Phosphomannomutase n=1 Tax=Spirochaeta isovalerica TaxID=150 RepID=A0A841R9T0_9SPIO|nr:phosphomannomutase/phosphoglucomutase [Spirochaeta isovalerica]MBB6482114.1 phosphomannomutase [Spirochaeta isovalerica]
MKHTFDSDILKECDIRGVVDRNLGDQDAYFVGRGFGTMLRLKNKKNCLVGRDGRLSSKRLAESTISGLIDAGIDVVDGGLIPTPAVYFGVNALKIQAGLMITASHNPPEYNGFKFLTDEGSFHGEDIVNLGSICREGVFAVGEGLCSQRNIIPEYMDYLLKFLDTRLLKNLKVVWDPGNGAAGIILSSLLEKIPGDHILICGEVDGRFPNHHPDPSLPENTIMLSRKVLEEKADLGIALDGDGDRMAAVDGKGRLLYGDQLLVLFSRDYLRRFPGATVMSEVKASRFFYDEIFAMGGSPLMWKVGHTNQKAKMKEEAIGLAGETSGHFFFQENYGFDDGLFAAIKLLNFLNGEEDSLNEIVDSFPVYHDSGEIRVSLTSEERHRVIEELKSQLRSVGRDHTDIDGIRVSTEEGFWMLRSSNTQPHLTIRCEALTKSGLEETMNELRDLLSVAGVKKDDLW